MHNFGIIGVMTLISISACTEIVENGNDTSFERRGPISCGSQGALEQSLMVGTESLPVRCGPQTQPVSG